LSYPVDYRPYDLHPQLATTRVIDFRQGPPEGQVELAFMLGVLEYIRVETPIIAGLRHHCRFAVISYVGSDVRTISPGQRAAKGWVRHQTVDELAAQFHEAGFTAVDGAESDGGQTRLWLWTRA
jgi:hypothetical protein